MPMTEVIIRRMAGVDIKREKYTILKQSLKE